ncbi:MAG: restriction endonuclease [Clostridia bacterium]|nr:restriction endonuclease [Clostridia bacterium]
MALLDFKEIPPANTGNGDQDSFELFAREFFSEVLHFEIVSEPNRGADDGKDLIAVEHQFGALSSADFKWLISCKHKAHSGQAVNSVDEENISDRMEQHSVDGFIGFYSTLPSSGLNNKLDAFKKKGRKIEIFSNERIETELIKAKKNGIIKRFFPESYKKELAKTRKNEPSIIFDKYEPLLCEYCGKDLLKEHLHDNKAIIVLLENLNSNEYVDAYACCKGHCDKALTAVKRKNGLIDEWEDISDWVIPSIFIRKEMALLNQLYSGSIKYNKETFEKLKHIILKLSQFALREEDDEQRQRLISLSTLPEWL